VTRVFEPALAAPVELASGRLWLCIRGAEILVVENGELMDFPLADDLASLGLEAESSHFLGLLDGVGCIAAGIHDTAEPPVGSAFTALRPLWTRLDEQLFALAGRAIQIVEWDRTHRFCGRCGTPTEDTPGERAKRCPACDLLAFPRVSPAMIVRVTRGDEILLAHGQRFPGRMYSVLAGFVDPGESIEEAIHRELREEVGIEVTDLRYFGSQPWPFPHSLMIGFTAEWAGGELQPDPAEIVDAGWYRADAMPPIPPGISIARKLIDDWLAAQARIS
jgi:NAD+ diphosphatase